MIIESDTSADSESGTIVVGLRTSSTDAESFIWELTNLDNVSLINTVSFGLYVTCFIIESATAAVSSTGLMILILIMSSISTLSPLKR